MEIKKASPAHEELVIRSKPVGRINQRFLEYVGNDTWGLQEAFFRFEELLGSDFDASPTPLSFDTDDYLLDKAKRLFQFAQNAQGLSNGTIKFGSKVREAALRVPVIDGEIIPVHLLAFCAFLVTSGRKTLPTADQKDRILSWYLNSYLRLTPSEISPEDQKLLLRAGSKDKDHGIEECSSDIIPRGPRTRDGGDKLRSGQLLTFTGRGDGGQYLLSGDWHDLELEHTWSRPWSAVVTFNITENIGSRGLLELEILLPSRKPEDNIWCMIALNGVPLKTIHSSGIFNLRLLFSGETLLPGLNFLSVHAPPFIPADHGIPDGRHLGAALRRMRICFDI